jgi:predicted nucleic acid-binding protein
MRVVIDTNVVIAGLYSKRGASLTTTLSYNEALELVNKKLLQASPLNVSDILNAIPDRKPLQGDEL